MSKSFSNIFLGPGDKILIVHRRLFERDKPRFFLGTVDIFDSASGLIKTTGYSFYPKQGNTWQRKNQPRTKVVSLLGGTLMVYQLPDNTNIDQSRILNQKDGLILDNGADWQMDLSEPVA